MDSRQTFGKALQQIRKTRNLTQEDFSAVSSRTYLSTLERGLKSPTLEKIEMLCQTMDVHPLTLLTLTYLQGQKGNHLDKLQKKIEKEIIRIQQSSP